MHKSVSSHRSVSSPASSARTITKYFPRFFLYWILDICIPSACQAFIPVVVRRQSMTRAALFLSLSLRVGVGPVQRALPGSDWLSGPQGYSMTVAAKWPAVDLPGCLARSSRAGGTTLFIIQFYRAQQEAVAGSLSPCVCVCLCTRARMCFGCICYQNPDFADFEF